MFNMSADESDSDIKTIKFETNSKKTPKEANHQELISKSMNAEKFNESKVPVTTTSATKIIRSFHDKSLNVKLDRHVEQINQNMRKSEKTEICERATAIDSAKPVPIATPGSMTSSSRRSSSSLENYNFPSLLQSTLNHSERHRNSLVNIYFNTIGNQKTSEKTTTTTTTTTTTMPTRTTTTTKTIAIKSNRDATMEKIATDSRNSPVKSKASNELDENSSSKHTAARFSRSHSDPIIKIDRSTHERSYVNIAINLVCNKNLAAFNDERIKDTKQQQQQQQQDKQEKTFNDESAKMTTSSSTTTISTTGTMSTRLRSSSLIIESGDEIASETDRQNNDHHIQQKMREDLRFGCAHYKRRAMFVTPCCNKFYKCRFCHDENETHHFDRKTLNELICSECNTRQNVREACVNCGVRFGKYICLICNLFDDEDKKQYHCNACGICRIGGAVNFFHCEVCNMCLPIQLKIDGHKCVENISRSHCPVCLGDIHTSRIPCHIPDCGHLLHKMCFDQLLASGHYACPTCQTSLIDMTALWDFLDTQAAQMPMPKKYESQKIQIFCNDCQRTSKTNFHFIGLKCTECGAYNTTHDVKRRVSLAPDETNTA